MSLVANDTVLVYFRRLDTLATDSTPGYSRAFKSPKLTRSSANDNIGKAGRQEHAEQSVYAQVETIPVDRLNQTRTGKDREMGLELYIDFRNLQKLGLVESNGDLRLRTGTRITKLTDRSGVILVTYDDPPGMYVEKIEYDGMDSSLREIAILTCSPRKRAL